MSLMQVAGSVVAVEVVVLEDVVLEDCGPRVVVVTGVQAGQATETPAVPTATFRQSRASEAWTFKLPVTSQTQFSQATSPTALRRM